MHKCPVCEHAVDVGRAYRRYSNHFGGIPRRQGVRCPACKTVLRIWSVGSVLGHLVLYLIGGASIGGLAAGPGDAVLWVALGVSATLLLLLHWKGHNLLVVSKPRADRYLDSDDSLWPVSLSERFDLDIGDRRTIETEYGVQVDPPRVRWCCSTCGTENSGERRFCTSCSAEYQS